MAEEHKHDYFVIAVPIATQGQRVKAAKLLENMLNEGWLPAGGFAALGTMPKDHTTWLMILARDAK